MTEYDVLQSSYVSVIKAIHATALARQAAREAGDVNRTAALTDQINRNIDLANGYAQRLREIEGPSSALVFLDKAGDVVAQSAGAAVQYGLDLTTKVASAAGTGAAKLLLPVLVPIGLLVMFAIFVAGRSGFFRATVKR